MESKKKTLFRDYVYVISKTLCEQDEVGVVVLEWSGRNGQGMGTFLSFSEKDIFQKICSIKYLR